MAPSNGARSLATLVSKLVLGIGRGASVRGMAVELGGTSKIQKVIEQAKIVFLDNTRTQSVKDSGFAADMEELKQLV